MEIWHSWTALLTDTLNLIASQLGVHQAVAIIVMTLLARLALMPISLTSAVRMEASKRKMKLLKPELEGLKELHKDDRAKLSSETMRLYRERGVTLMDSMTFANFATQGVLGIGLFQVLGKASITSKFLWITNLAKPDVWLSVLIVALMLLSMALMPGATSDTTQLITMVVSVAAIGLMIFAVPSTVGIYWATSSVVTLVQTLMLRAIFRSKARATA